MPKYYSIVKWGEKEVKEKVRLDGLYLISQDVIPIFETDSPRIAVSHAKPGVVIYLTSYHPDLGLVRKLVEKKSYLLFNLTDLLTAPPGSKRQRLMFNMSKLLTLCIKYKVNYVFSYYTDDPYLMRSLKESVALLSLLGLKEEQVKLGFHIIEDRLYW